MISLTSLIGCRTTDTITYEVPPLTGMPTRPILESIPSDINSALKSLTTNLGLVSEYAEKLEVHILNQNQYYRTVIEIITH